jgi:hypothetical protein
MKNPYHIKAFSALGWWVVCSLFIWPLAVIALVIVIVPLGMIYSAFEPAYYSGYYELYQILGVIVAIPIVGAVIGASMSALQRWLLRSKLYWAADKWRMWSMLGGAAAAAVVALVMSLFEPRWEDKAFVYMMPIFIGVVSAFQYLSLRHAVKDAWLWILGNVVAGLVFGGLLVNNQRIGYDTGSGLQQLVLISLAFSSLGIITASVILFLFEKKLLPMQVEGLEDIDPNRPKSVWDEAI